MTAVEKLSFKKYYLFMHNTFVHWRINDEKGKYTSDLTFHKVFKLVSMLQLSFPPFILTLTMYNHKTKEEEIPNNIMVM